MNISVPDFGTSLAATLDWWLMLMLLSIAGWSVLRPAVTTWHDRGWAIARPLAVLAFAFAIFVLGHLAPVFNTWFLRGVAVIALALLLLRARGSMRIDGTTWRAMCNAELRFVAPFLLFLLIRGFNHDIIGLEKFMDFAFVNAALRATTLPVPDPWFLGESINYYYFGHFVTAFLCKLSGVPAAYGFNLMLCTLFASVFQLAWALVAELGRTFTAALRSTMALLAGTWLCVGGNVHGFYFGFIRPWLVTLDVLEAPANSFLISDPTRFVGWNPPTDDKLIHEFPAYSFYVGDLHAHLLNLPWVLLFCCTLLGWLRARAAAAPAARRWLATSAWLVGIFVMANSWDALMYTALLGGLLVLHTLGAVRRDRAAARNAIGDAMLAGAVAAATAAPFLLEFAAHSDGFLRTHSHTPVWQWLVLYGLQAALAIAGCAVAATRGIAAMGAPERQLLAAMTVSGIAFALVPEWFYLKDIYGGAFYRGNTEFKFGFQAYTLLTLAACAGVGLLVAARPARVTRAFAAILLQFVLVPPLYYSWFVLQGDLGSWRGREWTLDGQRFLTLNYPEDRAITRWLASVDGGKASLLEAPGLSYTYGARIASNTGIPAVLGWPVHEQLWRGNDPRVWLRRDDIDAFYAARSRADAQRVVDRYHPRWIVLGGYERERYGSALDVALLSTLGSIAFCSGKSLVIDTAVGAPAAATP